MYAATPTQVNVCDICGDAGVENKLVICSRCNDGAEHTYCMKVKIDKVPNGEWLCEDCQADAETEIEKKKLQIPQVKTDTICSENYMENKEPINKCQYNGTSSKSNELDVGILSNTESVTYNVEHGVLGVGGSDAVKSDKTYHDHEQTSGAALNGQGEVIVCDVCGDVGDKKKLAVCGRCNDGAQHTYCMQIMVKEVPGEGWICETCQSELRTEKKNSKLEYSQVKIGAFKQVLIEMKVNKPANDAKIQSSSRDEVDTKYADNRESKRQSCSTSVGQISPEYGGIEVDCRKGALLSRGCSFKIGTEKGKLTASNVPTSVAPNALKSMARPTHGPLSKSISFNSSKIPKVKLLLTDVTQKSKHSKEPSSSTMKQLGPKSTVTMSSSLKKSSFCESTHKVKTLLKPNSETRVPYPPKRQNVNNNKGACIPGCLSVTASASMASLATSPTEPAFQHLTKGSAHGQGRKTLDHNEVQKPLSAKGLGTILLNRVKTSVDILASDTARKAVEISYPSHLDYKLNNPRSMDIPTMPNYLGNKALPFSTQHISPGDEQSTFTPPELNHIWQGGFELRRRERSLEFCDGIQAHLLCSASPKLIDLATKFPSKFQLEELPRHNVWPLQFQENCPTYGSIDILFFARDIHSYKNYYSKLVQNIVKCDLALRGNIETAELLIFASNTLPRKYQRWNMSSFLWGVLRVKTNDHVNLPFDVPGIPSCIGFKTAPLENEEQLGIMFYAVNSTNKSLVAPGVHGQGSATTANEYGTAQGDTLGKGGNGTPKLLPSVDSRGKRRKIAQGIPNQNKNTFKDQCTKRLVDENEIKAQSSKNSATSWSIDHVRQEIAQLLQLVIQDGAEEESDEHYYATQLLMEKKYRDMFLTLKTPNGRLKWLRRAWEDRKKN